MLLGVEPVHDFFQFVKQVVTDSVGFLRLVTFDLASCLCAIIAAFKKARLQFLRQLVHQQIIRVQPMAQTAIIVVIKEVLGTGS